MQNSCSLPQSEVAKSFTTQFFYLNMWGCTSDLKEPARQAGEEDALTHWG